MVRLVFSVAEPLLEWSAAGRALKLHKREGIRVTQLLDGIAKLGLLAASIGIYDCPERRCFWRWCFGIEALRSK